MDMPPKLAKFMPISKLDSKEKPQNTMEKENIQNVSASTTCFTEFPTTGNNLSTKAPSRQIIIQMTGSIA